MQPETIEKIEIEDADFEAVPDSYRRIRKDTYADLSIVKELLSGKTLRVPINTNTGRLYRFGKSIKRTLHKHKSSDGLIIWFEETNE